MARKAASADTGGKAGSKGKKAGSKVKKDVKAAAGGKAAAKASGTAAGKKAARKAANTAGLLPYEFYVDIVTKRYFDGVDTKNMQQVLDCFTPDAVLTEMTSNTVHVGRDAGIRKMFEGLFSGFGRIWHGNFVHVADPVTNAICSQFSVEIEPAGTATMLRYENTNRFYLKDRRFHRVYVYMSGDNLLK